MPRIIQNKRESARMQKKAKDLNVAFVNNDIDRILKFFSDDIVWNMVGQDVLKGIEAARESLEQESKTKINVLKIENLISHGDKVVINGHMTMENGKKFAFCDINTFDGTGKKAKVKQLDSYVIEL